MATATYLLEHFYYGQLVRDGKPESTMRVLTASRGVKHEDIVPVVKHALLPPLVGSSNGAWSIVRAPNGFVMVQAQLGSAGQTMLHCVFLPADVLRAAAGNLKALMVLIEEQMPQFEMLGDPLSPLQLPHPVPPGGEDQIDLILDLMTYTRNKLDTLETLLAAIVQGVQIVVLKAPRDLETRVGFVSGLLTLLPSSTRFGVTFATHTVTSSAIDAQIRFYEGDTPPGGTLVYEWDRAKLYGAAPQDDYARYIVSVLRLDAEQVIQRTRALTAIAAWRIKRGDRLADALGYASYRLKVDDALLNGQPVNLDDVSDVLASDPTLSDELRAAYARHVLQFALAMNAVEKTDPIAIMLPNYPELATSTLAQLNDALKDGKAALVYETVARWVANPLGPHSEVWTGLAQHAGLLHLEALVKAGNLEAVRAYLQGVQRATPGADTGKAVPRIIELVLPLTGRDDQLATQIFALSCAHLDTAVLSRLLRTRGFVARLPRDLARAIPYVTGDFSDSAPRGLLGSAVAGFEGDLRLLALLRLAEIALEGQHSSVFDTSALAGLAAAAQTPEAARYNQTLRWIAQNVAKTDDALLRLEAPGPRYLLQILLATGAYYELSQEMIRQSRLLFPGDLQADYAVMVQRLFAETRLPLEDVPRALQAIENGGIKLLPLTLAYVGALEGSNWAAGLNDIANRVTQMLLDNRGMLDVLPPDALISLLNFHSTHQDVTNAVRVASLVPYMAAQKGTAGIGIMARMYKLMRWEDRVKVASLELLRRFIREASDDSARKAAVYFGKELGEGVRAALETTLVMRRLMGAVDLIDYAGFVHTTAEFLQSTAQAYEGKNTPSIGGLQNDLDSMPGGLSSDDRKMICDEMLGLGRAIVALGDQYRLHRPRDPERHIDQLLNGREDPVSGLEVYYVMAGYFAKGKRFIAKLEEDSIHPLGDRSAPLLKDHATIANELLRAVTRALPVTAPVSLSANAIRGEMESLWGELSLIQQRELVRTLAADLQRIPQMVNLIAEKGDPKVVEPDSPAGRKIDTGKQRPKSTLELYRFIYAYFRSR